MKEQTGKFLGTLLLIAGCCIGAGMLGLPVVSAKAGFLPSSTVFTLTWGYMLITGLLLLEANLWYKEDVGIVTIAKRSLGSVGKNAAWILFLFLFYSLIVAYISGSGALLAEFFYGEISPFAGSSLTVCIFGLLLYLGTSVVDHWNRFLMAALGIAFLLLVLTGLPHVDFSNLKTTEIKSAWLAVPVFVISFGYHNLIPTATRYLNHDTQKLKWAIGIGSAIPLLLYLLWNFVMLGMIPYTGGFQETLDHGEMVTNALYKVAGNSWIFQLTEGFAFFAIITSLLSVCLSFVDFLSDGLKIEKRGKGKILLIALTLLPPFLFATLNPKIFLIALRYAGAFGAVLLFGVLPTLIVWKGRYIEKRVGKQLVPGGKLTLLLILIASIAIVLLEILEG